jgi:hypothetical protein
MDENLPVLTGSEHVIFLKLAREIAMDIRPLDDVLKTHGVDHYRWESISNSPRFQSLLRSEVESWESATNTAERVKIKALAFVEESLPEFFARAHDRREPLNSKVEVLKTIAKFAGVGGSNAEGIGTGERLMVTINLGADHSLTIEKDVTSKVIDHEDN